MDALKRWDEAHDALAAYLTTPEAAPQPPAQSVKRLTDDEIDKLMPPADGVAESNVRFAETEDGFPCVDFDEVDAWSREQVIAIARAVEAACAAAWGVKLEEPT